GIAISSSGTVFVADEANDRIRKINTGGTISTYAGAVHYGGDGGPASQAVMNWPTGVAIDGAGNIYITDYNNNRVRKMTASTGVVTTVAGTGVSGFSGDGGSATSARLSLPVDVVLDSAGNLYIVDSQNNRIRRVNTSGVISTFAGTGASGSSGDGGPATSAHLNTPEGIGIDASGNIYIADTGNNKIRKVNASTGIITTVAGSGPPGFSGDGGSATSAR